MRDTDHVFIDFTAAIYELVYLIIVVYQFIRFCHWVNQKYKSGHDVLMLQTLIKRDVEPLLLTSVLHTSYFYGFYLQNTSLNLL